MSQFHVLYSSTVKAGVLSGFFRFQQWSNSSHTYDKLFPIYFILVSLPGMFVIACNILCLIATEGLLNTRAIGGTTVFLMNAFDCLYFQFRSEQFRLLFKDFHLITEPFTKDELFRVASESVISYRAAKLNSILKFIATFYASVSVATVLLIYINHLVSGSADLLGPIPYDVNGYSSLYELTLIVQCAAAVVSGLRLSASCDFFVSMFFHLNVCLKQLRLCSKYIFQDEDTTNERMIQNSTFRNRINFGKYSRPRRLYDRNKAEFIKMAGNKDCIQDEKYSSRTQRFKVWMQKYADILRYAYVFIYLFFLLLYEYMYFN